jgi:hypothetical protein
MLIPISPLLANNLPNLPGHLPDALGNRPAMHRL